MVRVWNGDAGGGSTTLSGSSSRARRIASKAMPSASIIESVSGRASSKALSNSASPGGSKSAASFGAPPAVAESALASTARASSARPCSSSASARDTRAASTTSGSGACIGSPYSNPGLLLFTGRAARSGASGPSARRPAPRTPSEGSRPA